MPRQAYTYILASHSRALYVGHTTDLVRRLWLHRAGLGARFTARYPVHRLVWYELHPSRAAAAAREQQIKGWRRARKIELIERSNLGWLDLADAWLPRHSHPPSS